jgi:hypothetical protein
MSARGSWWTAVAAEGGAAVLLALGATWRLARIGTQHEAALLEGGHGLIFSLWHSRLLPLVYTHRNRSVTVLVGQHRDGELLARVITRLGYRTARGSSTRGGEEGVRDMLRDAERGHLLAITPDGPRGPAERVKPGLVYLASRTGYAVLPTAAAAAGEWALDSWDRFRVPKPFTRLVFGYGDPISVPPGVEGGEVGGWCARIEEAIRGVTAEVDRQAKGRS